MVQARGNVEIISITMTITGDGATVLKTTAASRSDWRWHHAARADAPRGATVTEAETAWPGNADDLDVDRTMCNTRSSGQGRDAQPPALFR